MSELTDKQEQFIIEYLIDLNATQAAIRAGYSVDTAAQIGYENLRKPQIAAAVTAALAERSQRTQITQDYVLDTVIETIERCKQAVPVLDRKGKQVFIQTPNGEMAAAYVFEPKAILVGAKLLGDHIGIFKQRVEHSGAISLTHEQQLAALDNLGSDDATGKGDPPQT